MFFAGKVKKTFGVEFPKIKRNGDFAETLGRFDGKKRESQSAEVFS